MIIQVRGTSGSGKSTAVTEWMKSRLWVPNFKTGRRKPLFYTTPKHKGLIVLGHYETVCGGCDTVGSAPAVYRALQDVNEIYPWHTAVTEGLLLSEDVKWTKQLLEDGHEVRALFLSTPTDQCLKRINQRRAEAGVTTPVKPHNTVNRQKAISRARRVLTEETKAVVRWVPSIRASNWIERWVIESLVSDSGKHY